MLRIIDALRPVAAILQLCATAPDARRGALWDSLYHSPQSVIDEAMERDLASANAEYLALFRSDIESVIASNLSIGPGPRAAPPRF